MNRTENKLTHRLWMAGFSWWWPLYQIPRWMFPLHKQFVAVSVRRSRQVTVSIPENISAPDWAPHTDELQHAEAKGNKTLWAHPKFSAIAEPSYLRVFHSMLFGGSSVFSFKLLCTSKDLDKIELCFEYCRYAHVIQQLRICQTMVRHQQQEPRTVE